MLGLNIAENNQREKCSCKLRSRNLPNPDLDDYMILGRLKIRKENILSMKIRANDIDLKDAQRFDSFSSVIINCKKYITALIL